MQIKTFEADSMTEALNAAKEAFGPEAVILGVKTGKPAGRFLGQWRKQKVTLTAATDTPYPDYDKVSISKEGSASPASSPPFSHSVRTKASRSVFHGGGAPIRTFARLTTRPAAKDMLPSSYVKKLFWLQQQMLMADVAGEAVRELLLPVHSVAVRRTEISEETLLDILEQVIQDRICPRKPSVPDNRLQKRLLFVGPTGVGKTTTLAKIATIYSRRRKSSVALITLDDQRIGGISQLAIYARILGIPMTAASSPAGLGKALRKFQDKQLILVDTAGINPNDPRQFDRLERLTAQIETPQVHLVLSTTTNAKDLKMISDAFKSFPVRHLLFTKVDESATQGSILGQALQTGISLSYYANGREIPDDIHVMTARRLMRMIFNETTLRRAKSASPEILAGRLQAFEDELDRFPLTFRPYRTFSTEWDPKDGKTSDMGTAYMKESSGGR